MEDCSRVDAQSSSSYPPLVNTRDPQDRARRFTSGCPTRKPWEQRGSQPLGNPLGHYITAGDPPSIASLTTPRNTKTSTTKQYTAAQRHIIAKQVRRRELHANHRGKLLQGFGSSTVPGTGLGSGARYAGASAGAEGTDMGDACTSTATGLGEGARTAGPAAGNLESCCKLHCTQQGPVDI